jgi:hypothetical protein
MKKPSSVAPWVTFIVACVALLAIMGGWTAYRWWQGRTASFRPVYPIGHPVGVTPTWKMERRSGEYVMTLTIANGSATPISDYELVSLKVNGVKGVPDRSKLGTVSGHGHQMVRVRFPGLGSSRRRVSFSYSEKYKHGSVTSNASFGTMIDLP